MDILLKILLQKNIYLVLYEQSVLINENYNISETQQFNESQPFYELIPNYLFNISQLR